jgi:hypothetical protein
LRVDIMRHEHQTAKEEGRVERREQLPDYCHEDENQDAAAGMLDHPFYSNSALVMAPPHYDVPSSPPPPPRHGHLAHRGVHPGGHHGHIYTHSHAHAHAHRNPSHAQTAPLVPTENMWSTPPHSPAHDARREDSMHHAHNFVQSPTTMTPSTSMSSHQSSEHMYASSRSPPNGRPSPLLRNRSSSSSDASSIDARQSRPHRRRTSGSGGIAEGLAATLAVASLGSGHSSGDPDDSGLTGNGNSRFGLGLMTAQGDSIATTTMPGATLYVLPERRERSRSPFRFMSRR